MGSFRLGFPAIQPEREPSKTHIGPHPWVWAKYGTYPSGLLASCQHYNCDWPCDFPKTKVLHTLSKTDPTNASRIVQAVRTAPAMSSTWGLAAQPMKPPARNVAIKKPSLPREARLEWAKMSTPRRICQSQNQMAWNGPLFFGGNPATLGWFTPAKNGAFGAQRVNEPRFLSRSPDRPGGAQLGQRGLESHAHAQTVHMACLRPTRGPRVAGWNRSGVGFAVGFKGTNKVEPAVVGGPLKKEIITHSGVFIFLVEDPPSKKGILRMPQKWVF